MTGARALAITSVLAALAAIASADQETPEALAERFLRAPEAAQQQLLATPEFASADVARALIAVGEKARSAAEFPRAVRAYAAAEAVARRAAAEKELGRALGGRGEALYQQGVLAPAMQAARESLRVRERLGDAADTADSWNTVGKIHGLLGEYPDALAAYQKALELWTSVGDRRNSGRALNNIGAIHGNAHADFDQALRYYGQALQIFDEVGDRRLAVLARNNIASVHNNRGEHALALEYCTRALAEAEALGDRSNMAVSLNCLGSANFARGAYAAALDAYERCLKLCREIGYKWQIIETSLNIGQVHAAQGDYRLAIEAYQRGLRLNKEMGGTTDVAEALYSIGTATWKLGQRQRAEANHRASLAVSEREGHKQMVAANLYSLGRIALETGRYAEAGRFLARALATREEIKNQRGIAESLNGLAALRLAVRRPAEALDLARRSADTARKADQPEPLWEAETLTGIAQRRLGQAAEARRSFEEAIRIVEGLRLLVVGRAQGRERFFESKLSPYQELIALAMAEGSAREALEAAERSKARALADLIQGGRAELGGAMSAEDRREEGRLRADLAALNRRIQKEREKDAPDAARVTALEAERQSKRAAFETFELQVYAKDPDLQVKRGAAAPFVIADADRLLPDDSVAVLEYAVADRATYLFVLAREQGVPRLRSYTIASGRRSLAPLAQGLRQRLASRDLAFADGARRLYDLLLAPALPSLRGRTHLIVVPDGPLWDVPFQALQDASSRYVVESAAVSYAPSLTVLRETVRKPVSAGPRTVLAMGKADFGSKGARPAVTLMSDLAPLPDAERQVRLIGELYGPQRSATFLGLDAREDRFKTEAPRHSVLHLATHGLLDETSPLYSNVVLTPGSAGSSEDGLLEAWEVLDLRLDADLVVLSACETGRGRIAPGEGIVGTMWAFFVAGSRALLVSQWKVESTSTTELMTAFHRRLAQGAGPKAQHLREASLQLLRDPRYAHPFYWAGFVLAGNPF